MDTLDDVDIDDDVDTELEVDTLREMKSQLYIKMWRKPVCTWSSFYLIVKANQTHFHDEVEALDDVDFEDDLGNEL